MAVVSRIRGDWRRADPAGTSIDREPVTVAAPDATLTWTLLAVTAPASVSAAVCVAAAAVRTEARVACVARVELPTGTGFPEPAGASLTRRAEYGVRMPVPSSRTLIFFWAAA